MNHSSNSCWIRFVIFAIALAFHFPVSASAQQAPNEDILKASRETNSLKAEQAQWQRHYSGFQASTRTVLNVGGMMFLFGAFCAIWAQNTGRNPLLWFSVGFLFTVPAVLVVLRKNSRHRRKKHYRRGRHSYAYFEY